MSPRSPACEPVRPLDAPDPARGRLWQVPAPLGLLLLALAAGCGPEIGDQGPPGDALQGERIGPGPSAELSTSPVEDSPGPADDDGDESVLNTEWLESEDGLVMVGFDRLAGFDYEAAAAALGTNAPPAVGLIPAGLRALDGREVAVKGFMLPLKLDGGLVTEFLLMRDQSMCCFGVIPKINEWINVRMIDGGVKTIMDQPITVLGTLKVGEVYNNEILSCIYELDGSQLVDALDL